MGVLHLKKCLLVRRAHSYIALKVLLCISPWSGWSRSPSLFLAGFSPFILAHVIWKKNFITRSTKEEGPGGVKQEAAVKRGRSFMFSIRDFAMAVSYAASEVSDVRRWIVSKISRPPPRRWLSVKQRAMQILFHFILSAATVRCGASPRSSALLLHRVTSAHSSSAPELPSPELCLQRGPRLGVWGLQLLPVKVWRCRVTFSLKYFIEMCQKDIFDAGCKFKADA